MRLGGNGHHDMCQCTPASPLCTPLSAPAPPFAFAPNIGQSIRFHSLSNRVRRSPCQRILPLLLPHLQSEIYCRRHRSYLPQPKIPNPIIPNPCDSPNIRQRIRIHCLTNRLRSSPHQRVVRLFAPHLQCKIHRRRHRRNLPQLLRVRAHPL